MPHPVSPTRFSRFGDSGPNHEFSQLAHYMTMICPHSSHPSRTLTMEHLPVQVVFVKRQPTANSTANESSSESDTFPSHWTEAADLQKEETSREHSRQTGHLAERRGATNLQLNLTSVRVSQL